jgi:hypothetical protein
MAAVMTDQRTRNIIELQWLCARRLCERARQSGIR